MGMGPKPIVAPGLKAGSNLLAEDLTWVRKAHVPCPVPSPLHPGGVMGL